MPIPLIPHPYLRLGHVRLPVDSLFAAAGLVAAMALGRRTSRLALLAPDSLPDAILTATLSAFLISRALLVLTNLHSFLTYPILILAVPSLTTGGIVLTAAVMFVWVRRRKIALLPLLDASAPCATLLWATLSLGRMLSTGSTGLPTMLPLAIDDRALGPVYPVELYTSAAALSLTAILLYRLARKTCPGQTLSLALASAGATSFLLNFLRQPASASELLDPTQWLALAMILAAAVLFLLPPRQPAANVQQPAQDPAHAL